MKKQVVVEAAMEHVRLRIQSLKTEMKEMTDESAQDMKSSSGDKHETDVAMTHLEMEKLGAQLELERQKLSELERIDLERKRDQIGVGSLVETNNGIFFIAVACGKIQVKNASVFGISPVSPLGQLLLAKTAGAEVELNGKTYEVIAFS